jgi:hypothetical protein
MVDKKALDKDNLIRTRLILAFMPMRGTLNFIRLTISITSQRMIGVPAKKHYGLMFSLRLCG